MKKLIVVDWLDKYGGAERVISSLTTIFQFDTCYTLVNLMSKQDQNQVFSEKTTIIKNSPLQLLKRKFRYLFFLFPYFIRKMKVDTNVRLIFSSSFSVSKGIKKSSSRANSHFIHSGKKSKVLVGYRRCLFWRI